MQIQLSKYPVYKLPDFVSMAKAYKFWCYILSPSAVKWNVVQCSDVLCSAVHCSALLCCVVWCSAVQRSLLDITCICTRLLVRVVNFLVSTDVHLCIVLLTLRVVWANKKLVDFFSFHYTFAVFFIHAKLWLFGFTSDNFYWFHLQTKLPGNNYGISVHLSPLFVADANKNMSFSWQSYQGLYIFFIRL